MGLFDKPAPAPAETTVPQAPQTPISLDKGRSVSLSKARAGAAVTLTCSWPNRTDYDLMALVEYADGHVEHVATFDAEGIPAASATRDGAVRHSGDQRRGGGEMASETITVTLNPQIRSIVPVVYSAQSNGTGSFRKYAVTSRVECEGESVIIEASSASRNPMVYSLVPAVVHFDGQAARLEALEAYSRAGNEDRPVVENGVVTMNRGPRNRYKTT